MGEGLKNPDRHTHSGVLGRPEPDTTKQARQILAEHGWTMNDFIVAAVVLLTKNPAPFLARLAEFRPAAKPPGRPKKSAKPKQP
jgi:hypothetical protein